jgi:ADP-dependent NAD(P)H-hydrate dehydratase
MPTSEPQVVTPALLRDWPLPEPGGDKLARGQLLVVGGTRGSPGAVLLAGESALRSGAGKLQIATVAATVAEVAVAVPEAMVLGLAQTAEGSVAQGAAEEIVNLGEGASVVLIGPGFRDPASSADLLACVVPRLSTAVVLDALASAYVTKHPEGLRHLAGRAILTLNPTELARTTGRDDDEVTRNPLMTARQLAHRSDSVVVCGAEEKLVVTPSGDAWVVQGGGPGLGISGSGDVHAGIVSGLLTRGAAPAQAAVWGAYIHARAGERLAAEVGTVGYLARELPGEVPKVLSELL